MSGLAWAVVIAAGVGIVGGLLVLLAFAAGIRIAAALVQAMKEWRL